MAKCPNCSKNTFSFWTKFGMTIFSRNKCSNCGAVITMSKLDAFVYFIIITIIYLSILWRISISIHYFQAIIGLWLFIHYKLIPLRIKKDNAAQR